MTGKQVKDALKKRGYKLAFVADAMGIIPQNLQSLLNVDDIKTGVLERIADAIGEKVFFFYLDKYGLRSEALENKIHQFSEDFAKEFLDVAAKVREVESRGQAKPELSEIAVKKNDAASNTDNRLWALIESQQRQLESQQRTIEALAKKGDVGDVAAVAR